MKLVLPLAQGRELAPICESYILLQLSDYEFRITIDLRAVTGTCRARLSPAITISYSAMLLEQPFFKAKEYDRIALSGVTKTISLTIV